MIDAWIIEELRKKEEKDRQEHDRIQIELPTPIYEEPPNTEEDEERGVVVLQL